MATQRPITNPVLTEISVTKDIDFLNLQADGLTMLRISSNGNVYAADGATFNSSGADLAERYKSQVYLEPGEVVAIDPQNNHGVMKTLYQYQPNTIGVVSTDPGFVAGAYTENSYPIALIGRVPVKVSTENGMIRQGDYLAPSSVPGHAMKATIAGHVIGKALESIDQTKLVTCPESTIQNASRRCGTVMMFVNLVDYLGTSIDDSLALYNSRLSSILSTSTEGLIDDGFAVATSTTSVGSIIEGRNQNILTYLEQLKTARDSQASTRSELFADKGSFITEVISPSIVSRLIKSDSIEGLFIKSQSVNTKTITASSIDLNVGNDGFFKLYGASSVVSVTLNDILSEDGSTTTIETFSTTSSPFIAVSFDGLGNGFFAGTLSVKSGAFETFTVSGKAVLGGLLVETIGTATSTLAIMSDTDFFGRPYFTTDTAGSAVIKSGAKFVEVVFDRDYIETPIVSATIALESASTSDDMEKAIFDNDTRFIVTRKNVHGFTILLNKPATTSIGFSWIALAVKNAKLFTSKDVITESHSAIENDVSTTTPEIINLQPIIEDIGTTTPTIVETEISTTTPPVIEFISTTTPDVIEDVQPTTTPEIIPVEEELQPEPIPELVEPEGVVPEIVTP
jgi:hypothetical protein